MRISQIRNYLATISPERSILILGPPGIGKSESVRDFAVEEAERMGLKFFMYDDTADIGEDAYVYVDLRLTEMEPSDLIGIPRDADGYVAYKPLRWAAVLAHAKAGMLFLDELTNISRPDLLAATYKIVLDRRVGFIKLPPSIRIIAAGNRPEESAVANLLPSPLVSRFHVVFVEPPSVSEWVEYMQTRYPEYDRRIAAYLNRFPEDFIRLPGEGETLSPYPVPRTWTWLANELPVTPDEYVEAKCIGYLGPEVGSRLSAFLRIQVDDPEELLNNPAKFTKYDLDKKWLAISLLATYARAAYTKRFEDFVRFLNIVAEESLEFVSVFYTLVPYELKAFTVKTLSDQNLLRKHEVAKLQRTLMKISSTLLNIKPI
ncbi:MAG: hypothetical protein NZ957_05770 [Thaumarchaeota archaeon]|nr:hypothetical protein [Candidatus Calditenuaceae archaeon]